MRPCHSLSPPRHSADGTALQARHGGTGRAMGLFRSLDRVSCTGSQWRCHRLDSRHLTSRPLGVERGAELPALQVRLGRRDMGAAGAGGSANAAMGCYGRRAGGGAAKVRLAHWSPRRTGKLTASLAAWIQSRSSCLERPTSQGTGPARCRRTLATSRRLGRRRGRPWGLRSS